MANRWGKNGNSFSVKWQTCFLKTDLIFLGSAVTADGDWSMKLRCFLPGRKVMTNLDSKWRHNFANKGLYSQSYGFSSSHVWIWELDHKEGWASKNWIFWTIMLEKTLESPLDSNKIKSVNPKESQLEIFIGRNFAEAEAPILGLPDMKSWLSEKTLMLGKIEAVGKGGSKDRMIGWHQQLNRHEFEWTPGDSEEQGSFVCSVHGVTKSQTQLSDWSTMTLSLNAVYG